ncbi:MAG: ATP-binding cassette domain-containing protein [Halobacteriovoraceae bacterium]|nr:ATP-binding cassette domain-containing protein [Halobacteriovoraceae bacterium]
MKEVFLTNKRTPHRIKDQFVFYLDDISVTFGRQKALSNITLTVNPGEIIFVTGKSGAGKTTLLNVLAGDQRVDSGRVLGTQDDQRFVAQVFQDLRLFPDQSCEDNIWYAYDSKLYKNKNEFYLDMMELVKVLGIKDRLNLKVSSANGGLKQKVAMVRALMSRPNVLLADEPTASLDKESSIKLFDVLNFYNTKRKLTVIWASHNRELVKQFPGKIMHLENGKLVYSGHACFI